MEEKDAGFVVKTVQRPEDNNGSERKKKDAIFFCLIVQLAPDNVS